MKTSKSVGKNKALFASIPVRSNESLARVNADGTVTILMLANDRFFFSLEGLSVEVWAFINGKRTVANIAETILKKRKNVPEKIFKEDVRKLFVALQKENIATLAPLKT